MAGEDLTVRDVVLMRAYLKQCVDSPVWGGYPYETDRGQQWLAELRERVRAIASRDDIAQALRIMTARRIYPLKFPSRSAPVTHCSRYCAPGAGRGWPASGWQIDIDDSEGEKT